MMNGGDLYELAKILGHSNIKMTERYAKLGRRAHHEDRQHGARDLDPDEEPTEQVREEGDKDFA